MGNLLKDMWSGVAGNAVWEGIKTWGVPMSALLFTLWGWVTSLPGPFIAVLVIFAVGAIFWTLKKIDDWKTKSTRTLSPVPQASQAKIDTLEFYEDRTAMTKERGGLANELQGVSRAWVSLVAGAHFAVLPDSLVKKIDKLILTNPDSEVIAHLSRFPQYEHANFQFHIRAAIQRGKSLNIPLRVSPIPTSVLIIGEPDEPVAWARMQVFMPYVLGSEQPSFIVRKSDHPQLFQVIKSHFEDMWRNSHESV